MGNLGIDGNMAKAEHRARQRNMTSHRVMARTIAAGRGLSAQVIRTTQKILGRVDARLRRRLPQQELEQIVQRALAARYPEAYYRLRSDHRPAVGTYLPYNVSVVDVGPAKDSLWRCAYDRCIDNLCSSRSITLAVVSKPIYSQDDPRGDWRAGNESLKVLNPDECTDVSSDSKSEALSVAHSYFNPDSPTVQQPAKGSRRALISGREDQGSNYSNWDLGSIDQIEDPVSLSRLNRLIDELILEATRPQWSVDIPVTRPCLNRPGDEVPHLPVLYSISRRRGPPLCCLITSSINVNNPSLLQDHSICISPSGYSDPMSASTPKSPVKTIVHDMASIVTCRPRHGPSSFYLREANTEHLLPRSLTIRKANAGQQAQTATVSLQPRFLPPPPNSPPKTAPKAPYSLLAKMREGELPPIPTEASEAAKQVANPSLETHIKESAWGSGFVLGKALPGAAPKGARELLGLLGPPEAMRVEQRYFCNAVLSDLDQCVNAGASARCHRYLQRGFI